MCTDPETPFALIVYDDFIVREDACAIVREAGFRHLEATNADGALALLEEHADDIGLLFTDGHLSGERNGFDLAREADARWPDLKILIAAGLVGPNHDHLPPNVICVNKPFSAELVKARLQELLPDGEKPEPLKRRSTA